MSLLLLALSNADERLLRAVVVRRRPVGDAVMRALTRLGDVRVIFPGTSALALGAIPWLAQAGFIAFWSLVGSHVAVQVLKGYVCRERPRLPMGLSFLIEPEDCFSFPSGHAAAGLSLALPLFLAIGGLGGFCFLVLGLGVGLSRCYLGVHYPGDVLVGWLLAVLGVVGVAASSNLGF